MAGLTSLGRRIGFRGLSAAAAALLAAPLGWKAFAGLYLWLSPFLLLNSALALRSFVELNALGFLVLAAALAQKRWFCRHLCPVGWGCDLAASCRQRRNFSTAGFPHVGRWLAASSLAASCIGVPLFQILDPMALFHGFFTPLSAGISAGALPGCLGLPLVWILSLWYPGLWCSRLCPLGGLQEEIAPIGRLLKPKAGKADPASPTPGTRRRWLLSSLAAGVAAALLAPRALASKKDYLRPPGSMPVDRFAALCLRCGNCIRGCPTGILHHHMDAAEPISWMVPSIRFEQGYCLEPCNLCSRVCPSGAITLFDPAAKDRLPIGLAEIREEECLLAKNRECDRCKASCRYRAIAMTARRGSLLTLPEVLPKKCVGCGACEVICPTRAVRIRPGPPGT